MPEAPLRMSKNGLVVGGEGWFVVNARESRWKDEGPLGSYCTFEGKRRFPHFGINISVLEPGERIGMYHRERAQEAFLVLAGECTLIVEGRGAAAGRMGLLLLRAGDRAHHRGGRAAVGRGAGRRRARTRRRRWPSLHRLQGRGTIRSQRNARDCGPGGRLRQGVGEASSLPFCQVPARLAAA